MAKLLIAVAVALVVGASGGYEVAMRTTLPRLEQCGRTLLVCEGILDAGCTAVGEPVTRSYKWPTVHRRCDYDPGSMDRMCCIDDDASGWGYN